MRIYSCEVKCVAAALDAFVNEYLIYSSPGASHSYSTNIRAWMEMENRLRIKVSASTKAKEGDNVQFDALAAVVENQQRRLLAGMSFPAGIAPPDVATIPFDTLGKNLAAGQSLSFTSLDPADVVVKPWNETDQRIKTPQEIYQLYAYIQKQFVDGNVEEIMRLSKARIVFGAKLYEQTEESYENAVRKDLVSTLASKPQWKTIQDPDRQLTIHEFLEGKVVRVLDLKGNPPLRTVADHKGFQFGYDIILAMTAKGLVWIM